MQASPCAMAAQAGLVEGCTTLSVRSVSTGSANDVGHRHAPAHGARSRTGYSPLACSRCCVIEPMGVTPLCGTCAVVHVALSLHILAMLRTCSASPIAAAAPPLPSSASEIVYWRDQQCRTGRARAGVVQFWRRVRSTVRRGEVPAHSDPVRAEDHHCPRHELSLYRAQIGEQEPEQARGASIRHATKAGSPRASHCFRRASRRTEGSVSSDSKSPTFAHRELEENRIVSRL